MTGFIFLKGTIYLNNQRLLKISEASRLIGLSRYYVYKFLKEKKLTLVIIDDAKFVTVESVKKLLSEMLKGCEFDV